MALKVLLQSALEKGCKILQIFGDSMLIINWATGAQSCHSPRLHLILEEVLLLKHNFDFISIMHVYKERNKLAGRLSKEGTELPKGQI